MRRAIIVPELDLPGRAVTVSLWHVKTGERVAQGEPVVELAAGELIVDLSAPINGRIAERLVLADDPVATGQTIGWIEADD